MRVFITNEVQLWEASMRYRSRTEIVRDILQTVRNEGTGAGKTKIMYNAYLSHNQLRDYLSDLVNKNLLEHDIGNRKFRITEKGLGFLSICDQIGDLMEVEEEEEQKRL